MSTLLIEGGRKLSGRITVDGNKNSALPLVAACLLSEETCRLENVPRISDIRVMADLLTGVGARVSGLGTPTLEITTPKVTSATPDATLVANRDDEEALRHVVKLIEEQGWQEYL